MAYLQHTAPCHRAPRVVLPAPQRPSETLQRLTPCNSRCIHSFQTRQSSCQARTVIAAASTIEVVSKDTADSQQEEPQIPADIADSVVTLEAPNASAPGGKTKVYVLGMSHVSKVSVEAVRSLIAAVQPEVRPKNNDSSAGPRTIVFCSCPSG